ncbi:MAG: DNA alkylation repair protein [Dysgonamonadaceae bacterium]|jgi:3-methyladenine DNA glycosylase AlkD|nr:DNA alkylation repair protein [Dysgonamonadaceae bacterium]
MNATLILNELIAIADPQKAAFLQRFFKTGKGQYAEGDVMLGITVPQIRNVVRLIPELPFAEIQILIDSEYHEARMTGLLTLVKQFKAAKTDAARKAIFDFYILNAHRANNWDLVDVSCRDIVGQYLLNNDRSILYTLAADNNIWKQRIAIVSTWTFIKHRQFDDTLAISEQLLTHRHDLIHKATGWMLREIGKKDRATLVKFLDLHHQNMPRTALRYAIEHFLPNERECYMKK